MTVSGKKPAHVGIIMDGNGRWAQLRGHQRFWGHLKGAKVARQIIEECSRENIQALTLYAFSTENWFRPTSEVSFLMKLLARQLRKERVTLMKNNIRFSVIGETSRLPKEAQVEVAKTIEQTATNTGMHLIFALSYGSRQEITQACAQIAAACKEGRIAVEEINENLVSQYLQTSGEVDPDLVIRTSGEFRLSNFMLWQSAYSEFYTCKTLWPDFTPHDLHVAFAEFSNRERRFGKVDTKADKTIFPGLAGARKTPRAKENNLGELT